LRALLLALLVPALMLLIVTDSLGRLGLLPWPVRTWLGYSGLLSLAVALCVLSYWRERRLAEWSLPGLGVAVAMLALGAGVHLLLFVVGLALTVVSVAAALHRPIWGRAWEKWLLVMLLAGTVLAAAPMWPPAGPPAAPANALQSALVAILYGPQSFVSVCGMFGIFSILIGRGLAPALGLRSGLVLAGTLAWVWTNIGDPAYALGMWTNSRALVHFMAALPVITLTLVVLAVLLARSERAQWLGFLVPMGAGLLAEAVVDLSVRPYASVGHTLTMAALYILPLVVALWVARPRSDQPALPLAAA
jgi:hypothetical protein